MIFTKKQHVARFGFTIDPQDLKIIEGYLRDFRMIEAGLIGHVENKKDAKKLLLLHKKLEEDLGSGSFYDGLYTYVGYVYGILISVSKKHGCLVLTAKFGYEMDSCGIFIGEEASVNAAVTQLENIMKSIWFTEIKGFSGIDPCETDVEEFENPS